MGFVRDWLAGALYGSARIATAVRNLDRAGVSRSVAMQMVGHRTEAIYRRYAIVSDADLRAAADKLAAIDLEPTTGTVTRLGAR